MKNCTYLLNIILWITVVYAQYPKGLTMHRQYVQVKDKKTGWYVGKSTEGKYSVLMPIPFNDFTVSIKGKNGDTLKTYGLGTKTDEGYKFSASKIVTAKKINLYDLLEGFKGKEGTISHIVQLDNEGYQLLEFRVGRKAGKNGAFIKYVYYDNSLYTLIVEYFDGNIQGLLPFVKTFFNSLDIKSSH